MEHTSEWTEAKHTLENLLLAFTEIKNNRDLITYLETVGDTKFGKPYLDARHVKPWTGEQARRHRLWDIQEWLTSESVKFDSFAGRNHDGDRAVYALRLNGFGLIVHYPIPNTDRNEPHLTYIWPSLYFDLGDLIVGITPE